MKISQTLLLVYSILLSVFVTLGAVAYSMSSGHLFFFLLFLPIIAHFLLPIFKIKAGYKLFLYYSFILVTIMAIMGFMTSSTVSQLISAILFCPLAFYFWALAFPKKSDPLIIPPQTTPGLKEEEITKEQTAKSSQNDSNNGLDQNRRMFVKLIGTAGLGVLIYSLFSKKAGLPLFNSSPGPTGTVALKNIEGVSIDPAVKQPTDGYKISEVDDSSPTYFGFVEKPRKWFIMQISDSGTVRYAKGDGNFAANWKNRDNLKYDYYDAVF